VHWLLVALTQVSDDVQFATAVHALQVSAVGEALSTR
jgi:hypothetical protein